jgi:hypothetical protein
MHLIPIALLFFCCVQTSASVQDSGFRLRNHQDQQNSIASLARAHSANVSVETIASSRGEREISVLRLTGSDEAPGRPAILLVANLEGTRVFSSALALNHAWKLAEEYATEDGVRAFLDSTVLYILPRANPDAAEARFIRPLFERLSSGHGIDDDRDGRQGEDPPSDVDGDGFITQIRLEDPEGEWIADPTDARILIKADRSKGERGQWKLHTEGRDLDGDERVAEDAALNARVERNFPAGWKEHDGSAGLFPGDEPEVRGLIEFILAHPEIAMVVIYDAIDNLVETPKGIEDEARSVKLVPPSGVRESDVKYLKELGKRYREGTGSEAKSSSGDDAGSFQRWCYEFRGLWTLASVLWDMPIEAPPEEPDAGEDTPQGDAEGDIAEEAAAEGEEGDAAENQLEQEDENEKSKEPEPSVDAKRLRWVDAVDPARFDPWEAFEHPELGSVQIGGFAPFARFEPPADAWEELAGEHLEYVVSLGDKLARISFAECTREELGEGVWRVTAVLENGGLLPFLSRSARNTRSTRPGRLQLELPDGATLLGGRVQSLVSEIEGSGGRHETTWLVLAPEKLADGIRVVFDSDHAGQAQATPKVKP